MQTSQVLPMTNTSNILYWLDFVCLNVKAIGFLISLIKLLLDLTLLILYQLNYTVVRITVWFLSSIVRNNQIGVQFAQIFVFIFAWLIFRVVIVYNNQGQSLGRWAFDLKLLEVVNGEIVSRIPQFQTLLLREGIICFSSLLLSIFLANIILNPAYCVIASPNH